MHTQPALLRLRSNSQTEMQKQALAEEARRKEALSQLLKGKH